MFLLWFPRHRAEWSALRGLLQLFQAGADSDALTVAHQLQLCSTTGAGLDNHTLQLYAARDRLVIKVGDDITRLQPGFRGWPLGIETFDEHTFSACIQSQSRRSNFTIADGNAQAGAAHASVLDESVGELMLNPER